MDRLRALILRFCKEKRFEGCAGLEITDEIRVIIAAQACLLALHLNGYLYPRVSAILVYPSSFMDCRSNERGTANTGESWPRDYIVFSWEAVLAGARRPADGSNVVYHEFAHQFDGADGSADGTPPFADPHIERRARHLLQKEYRKLCRAVDHGKPTLLDYYGATNEAEFFAVATEFFFERAHEFKERHPDLFDLLSLAYNQDPLFAEQRRTTCKLPDADRLRITVKRGEFDDLTPLRQGEQVLQRVMLFLSTLAVFAFIGSAFLSPIQLEIAVVVTLCMLIFCDDLFSCAEKRRGDCHPNHSDGDPTPR